ncbi:hypothetical protein S83_020560, partial [Arachis hypogaea]
LLLPPSRYNNRRTKLPPLPVAVDVNHQLASPLFSPLLLRQREIKSRVKRGNQTPQLFNHQIL